MRKTKTQLDLIFDQDTYQCNLYSIFFNQKSNNNSQLQMRSPKCTATSLRHRVAHWILISFFKVGYRFKFLPYFSDCLFKMSSFSLPTSKMDCSFRMIENAACFLFCFLHFFIVIIHFYLVIQTLTRLNERPIFWVGATGF